MAREAGLGALDRRIERDFAPLDLKLFTM